MNKNPFKAGDACATMSAMHQPVEEEDDPSYGAVLGGVTWPTLPGSSGPIPSAPLPTAIPTSGQTSLPIGPVGQQLNLVSPLEKTKVRYVIIKKGGSTLELQEQDAITPRELIGLAKLMNMVSTFTTVVLGTVGGGYNFHIVWSKLISQLGIEKHFVDGLPVGDYNNDDEVLDVFLIDPT
jgi:hypothetical protein